MSVYLQDCIFWTLSAIFMALISAYNIAMAQWLPATICIIGTVCDIILVVISAVLYRRERKSNK